MLVTYNRLPMLRRCLASLLEKTRGISFEIVVWDNASTDGTREYLDDLASRHDVINVIHNQENVGVNGVAAAVRRSRGFYLVEMDDDVIDVPDGWLAGMIEAFRAVPRAGYLAANVVQDDITDGAKPAEDLYVAAWYASNVVIEHGPTGGWCTITSRKVIDRIGNFLELPGRVFFSEDGDFAQRCLRHRYAIGIVRDVRVYHATGAAANAAYGTLEVARSKYSDSEEYRVQLEETLAAIERRSHDEGPDAPR